MLTNSHGPGECIFILIWVDDIFMLLDPKNDVVSVKDWEALQIVIKVNEREPISDCLGCEIKRDRKNRRTFLTQEKSIYPHPSGQA